MQARTALRECEALAKREETPCRAVALWLAESPMVAKNRSRWSLLKPPAATEKMRQIESAGRNFGIARWKIRLNSSSPARCQEPGSEQQRGASRFRHQGAKARWLGIRRHRRNRRR